MRVLTIECATEACSVALYRPGNPLGQFDHDYRVLGRGHAEALVPMIAALPDKGKADRILVSLGPGSFTGIRVGLAAARALALAWKAECLGYPTLALVAAGNHDWGTFLPGQMEGDPADILVCMEGGHGDWFVQPFNAARAPTGPCRTMSPDQAVAHYPHHIVVGSRAKAFVERRGWGKAHEQYPDAISSYSIPADLLTSDLTPVYGRAPDARLPAGAV